MARGNNQGGGQNPGNNTPKVPMATCPKCSKDVPKGKLCNECGYKFEVECPACKKTVLNKVRCYECGAELGKKPTPAKPQEVWDIEVSEVVTAGKGTVRIQVTKDREGIKDQKVWVSIRSDKVGLYHDASNGKWCIKNKNARQAATSQVETDKKGFAELEVNFDASLKVSLYASIIGTQADTKRRVVLYGPRKSFKLPTVKGFLKQMREGFSKAGEVRRNNQTR